MSIFDTPDTTSSYQESDIADNKVMAVLSYLWILVLIPILAAPNSPYARFHASQGLTLLLVDIAWGVVSGILSFILGFIPVINLLWGIIVWLVGIALFVMTILGIVNAVQGKAKELPLIGSIRILK